VKTVVNKRDGSQVPFNAQSIAKAILIASEKLIVGDLNEAMFFGSPANVTKRKVIITFLASSAIYFLFELIFDRRQLLTWVNSVFIIKLYVNRPNNKSPPAYSIL